MYVSERFNSDWLVTVIEGSNYTCCIIARGIRNIPRGHLCVCNIWAHSNIGVLTFGQHYKPSAKLFKPEHSTVSTSNYQEQYSSWISRDIDYHQRFLHYYDALNTNYVELLPWLRGGLESLLCTLVGTFEFERFISGMKPDSLSHTVQWAHNWYVAYLRFDGWGIRTKNSSE